MPLTAVAVSLVALLTLPTALPDVEADRRALLEGVEVLERRGTPGTLCVYGDDAFAVLTANKDPEPVVAAARHGKGRVVAWAHGAYISPKALSDETSGTARLLTNALAWSSGKNGKLRIGILGTDDGLARHFGQAGHKVDQSVAPAAKAPFDVLVWRENIGGDPEQLAALRAFVKRGGGLLAAQCPWGYEQVNAKRGLTLRDDLPQNKVLRPLGLVFAGGYGDATGGGGYAVAKSRPEEAHAGAALNALAAGEKGAARRTYLLVKALRSLPADDDAFLPRVMKRVGKFDPDNAPTTEKPLRRSDGLALLQATWALERWKDLPPEEVRALPGSDIFPGAVPSKAPRVEQILRLDPKVEGWQCTGLYLAAGDLLEVDAEANVRGWRVRIGCHTDRLWGKDHWRRWPEVAHHVDLTDRATRVATPFGGSVYFERISDKATAIEVHVKGAVEAPRYVLGDTPSSAAWKKSRKAPGPWAEIEGRNMVLSVPSKVVRDWDDPGRLIAWWDRVLATHCELAGTPLPTRRERFVPDVQISAGYMHSGYPIMTHLDVVQTKKGKALPPMLDFEALSKEGTWGFFHELGHNRQRRWWTFDGTGEVTCNWFSLYTNHKLVGVKPWRNPWLENQKQKAHAHVAAGAPFAEWKRRPGIALVLFAQIQKAFGWEPFERVLGDYETGPESERPTRNQDKIDEFVRRMSLATRRDLRPFIRKWGLPLGKAVEGDAQLGALEAWMPDSDEILK